MTPQSLQITETIFPSPKLTAREGNRGPLLTLLQKKIEVTSKFRGNEIG
jgi:hypothetical protein